jgi:hypothetical protein
MDNKMALEAKDAYTDLAVSFGPFFGSIETEQGEERR